MSVERLEKGNFDPNISVLASSELFERDVCFFIYIFLQLITAASLWRIRLLLAGTELERYWSVCACLELNDDNFFWSTSKMRFIFGWFGSILLS